MKNITKITALILTVAISFSTTSAFASEKVNEAPKNIENNIEANETAQPQAFYNSFTGTVKELTDNTDGSAKVLVENKDGSLANFIISKNTYYVDKIKIEVGTQITGYYEAGKPMIMIYPAQYSIEIVAPVIDGKNIKADKFDDNLLSFDKTLKLNISDDTEILWENGTAINWFAKPTVSELETVLSNRKLVAFYDFTTKSIPAQTTPYKLIVLSQQEDNSNINIIINDIKIEAPTVYKSESDVIMVPIRAISEALGYKVTWNNEQQSVMLGDDISLTIGKNSYNISGKTPVELEASPILNNERTYVPLNFFKEIINMNEVSFFENNVIIKGK